MQKKNIWAVLAAVLLMVLATNGVMADEEVFKSRDYEYRVLEDGAAEITSYSGKDSVLKIPNTLDGKTVTSIGDEAFSGCRALTSIELPDSVTSMGVNLFAGCESLKNIQVSLEQPVFAVIDGVLFNKAEKSLICYPAGKQEEAYEVPQGIQQIKFGAFAGCRFLTTIELPDSVTSIGDGAFAECSALTNIELPDGLTSIGEYAFLGCSALTSIELPDSVTSIGDKAFWGCSALTSIELPDSVTSIGDKAFWGCSALTSIELPDSVTSIGDSAFLGCSALTNIELPDSVTSMGVNPFEGCMSLKNIQVSQEQPVFAVIDGVLFNKAEKSLICYPTGKQEEAYEVPQGIQQIKFDAFAGCRFLTTIELPDSVTSIGDRAFEKCDNLTMTVQRDSYAARYAKDNNLNYTYPDANDWLNN